MFKRAPSTSSLTDLCLSYPTFSNQLFDPLNVGGYRMPCYFCWAAHLFYHLDHVQIMSCGCELPLVWFWFCLEYFTFICAAFHGIALRSYWWCVQQLLHFISYSNMDFDVNGQTKIIPMFCHCVLRNILDSFPGLHFCCTPCAHVCWTTVHLSGPFGLLSLHIFILCPTPPSMLIVTAVVVGVQSNFLGGCPTFFTGIIKFFLGSILFSGLMYQTVVCFIFLQWAMWSLIAVPGIFIRHITNLASLGLYLS